MLLRHPIALLFLTLLLCNCQSPNEFDASSVTLTNGQLSITAESAHGGRISSLRFAGREILRTTRDSSNYQWGSTVWNSPQADWNWPPVSAFDQADFALSQPEKGTILLQGTLDSASQLRMTKRIVLSSDSVVLLEYRLQNEGRDSVSVALWENTRLPYAGRLEFAPDTLWSVLDSLESTPNDKGLTIHFDERHKGASKLFAGLPDGVATYFNKGLRFRKLTDVTTTAETAPGQAPLEIYVDPEINFLEFEIQGAYRRLAPAESVELRVAWEIGVE